MRVFGPLPPARWVPGPLWRVAATRRDDEERLLRWLCEPCARWEPCWELRAPLELCDAEFEARCELLESYASLPALRVDVALRALRGRDEALRFCEAMVATVAGAPEKPLLVTGTLTNLRLAGDVCRLGKSAYRLRWCLADNYWFRPGRGRMNRDGAKAVCKPPLPASASMPPRPSKNRQRAQICLYKAGRWSMSIPIGDVSS